MRNPEFPQDLLDRPVDFFCALAALRGEPLGDLGTRFSPDVELFPKRGQLLFKIVCQLELLPDRLPVNEDRFERSAVLFLQERELSEPVAEVFEAFRIELDSRIVLLDEFHQLVDDRRRG